MFRLSVLLGTLIALSLVQQGLTEEECDGLTVGKTLQDPEDCHGYFLCHGTIKMQQYCSTGMKYDADSGTCVVGKCPPCNCSKEPTPSPSPPTDSTLSPTPPAGSTPSPSPPTDMTPSSDSTPSPTPPAGSTPSPTPPAGSTPSPSPSTDMTPSSDPTPPPTPPAGSTPSPTSPAGSTPSPSPPTDMTPSSDPTPSPTPPTDSTPLPPVSCNNIPEGAFLADPAHCRDYWVCRNGRLVLLHCQWGMWFDDVYNVCHHRHMVNCPANID